MSESAGSAVQNYLISSNSCFNRIWLTLKTTSKGIPAFSAIPNPFSKIDALDFPAEIARTFFETSK